MFSNQNNAKGVTKNATISDKCLWIVAAEVRLAGPGEKTVLNFIFSQRKD